MVNYLCVTCGTQYGESDAPPAKCAICEDARQYVPVTGQKWTTLEEVCAGHRNLWQNYEPDLFGIGTTPEFAIGQRALLIRTPDGNFLWDCIALLDQATIELLYSFGRIKAIAISHPHYYTTMVEWSRALDNAPIYLHAADREWVMRPDKAIRFWEGEEKELASGIKLIRAGGHFPGGTILHWRAGADSRGALLTGDILQVTPDRMVSCMFSYPNLIPLSTPRVQEIGEKVAALEFDRIYGAFWDRVVPKNGREVVQRSLARYRAAIDSNPNYKRAR
jgi:glyoxylase-like metal-dependent hydrolase (beta-lactamase superfamily II)